MRRAFVVALVIVLAFGTGPGRGAAQVAPSQRGVGVLTDEWAVRLVPGADPNDVAAQAGAVNLGGVGMLRDVYVLQGQLSRARLLSDPRVLWVEQQIAVQQHPRAPSDPLYPSQWHLSNRGQSGGTPGQDANVEPAWQAGTLGTGALIGIVDDGLQHTHPDLAPNYQPALSWDYNGRDPDPAPAPTDRHGTAVGGVAGARDDGAACGVGVAYRAGLAGIRLIAGPATDADEASALTHRYDAIQVYNNSWGPFDDGARLEGPGPLTLEALEDGATNGRGGLGSIYVWAGGNGRQSGDDVNYDGYANSRFTIAVGAVDHNGVQSYYSEPGAALVVVAPSSGSGAGITTTDLRGADGYTTGDCYAGFGGTSSAAPLVAGVVALTLEANPLLTWRDVQQILIDTAQKNDPLDPEWTANGAGRLVSHRYGFGRVDAAAAVRAARTWASLAPATSRTAGPASIGQALPDNNASGVTSTVVVADALAVEHVEVVLNATHPRRGDLEVVLTSPSGTRSVLARRHGDAGANYAGWRFMSTRHWGESSAGTWSLRVADVSPGQSGTFDSWTLIVHGALAPATPTATATPTPTATEPIATPTPTATVPTAVAGETEVASTAPTPSHTPTATAASSPTEAVPRPTAGAQQSAATPSPAPARSRILIPVAPRDRT
ncbi:MAG TPA: S8 family serine peptidase [Chloroflexota bacterium]|jgi:subtilisin-like proprotein convertase family protein|nr:S8 family serine peptidase [Chloroflexota bacterium]